MLFEADYAKNYASIMYQCLVTSTAAYSKVLSSMENALILLEIAAKCSNYAKN